MSAYEDYDGPTCWADLDADEMARAVKESQVREPAFDNTARAIAKIRRTSEIRADIIEVAKALLQHTGESEYTLRVDGALPFDLTIKRTDK